MCMSPNQTILNCVYLTVVLPLIRNLVEKLNKYIK